MITVKDGLFALHTDHTSYLFRALPTGHLEHLYYGAAIPDPVERGQQAVNGGGAEICYSQEQKSLCMDDICLEVGTLGTGDLRQPMVELTFEDGTRTCDFLLERYEVLDAPRELRDLPGAINGGQSLVVYLKEAVQQVRLELHYTIFPDCDCIVRSAVVDNCGTRDVRVNRLMSAQLDLDGTGYRFTSFQGNWAREMNRVDTLLESGIAASGSSSGFSGNKANPFVMVSAPGTTETTGQVIATNLIYSGSHLEQLEAFPTGKTRLLTGIHPQGFSWKLESGQRLESPQMVMSFSVAGFRGISLAMHRFVREHIVAARWQNKPRPVALNSWEVYYFKINQSRLKALAQSARDVGIELFVLDDGWFGQRTDDDRSLGDWFPDEKKLPKGLEGVARMVNGMGMELGIWVEPEMVSENSQLYDLHPDWAVQMPGRKQSLGRNQYLLDLSRPAVQDWIIQIMTDLFDSADIQYVKWDMNRDFSEMSSAALPADRQGEFGHRYMMGLYRILRHLTRAFPEILFEGCAGGGNRFDLGMLCYFPQIWASDNTDGISRATIQNGYSYGYPQSVVSCHVSDVPNHQTRRETPLATRFNVAAFGILGYECDLTQMSAEDRETIREQIRLYKKYRSLFQFGQLYRIGGKLMGERIAFGTPDRDLTRWMVVSPDKSRAAAVTVQETVQPNQSHATLRCAGLAPNQRYRFRNVPQKDSRKGNILSRIEEKEDFTATGRQLCFAGVPLAQGFAGCGMAPGTRLYQDFASRMYLIEKE